MTSQSKVGHFSAYSFDASIMDTILALTQGATICVISEEDRLNCLADAMSRLQVTWCFLTRLSYKCWSLNRYLSYKLFGYGPTETSVICVFTRPLEPTDDGSNIGRPLVCQAWVTDTTTTERLLPIGTVGEIVIQGPNVGRGYMNSLAKAQSGFIDSPSWSSKVTKNVPGRFYRTGDLGRLNHDGSFTIVGRKDDQVKLRGQRIELHEVEYHINKGPIIQEAIVVVPVEGPFKQRLVTLVRLKDVP
ncbi:Nonribosomal peptide synthetase 1, partial [Fusarium culmorum]